MSISSTSIKSTGMSDSSPKSTMMDNRNSDGNPHPSGSSKIVGEYPGDRSKEYREVKMPGITEFGVGSMSCNDAACEKIVKHPTAEDLADAGSMRGR